MSGIRGRLRSEHGAVPGALKEFRDLLFVIFQMIVGDDEKKAAIVEMRDDKKTYSEIARELGISRSTVRNYYIRFLDESTDA